MTDHSPQGPNRNRRRQIQFNSKTQRTVPQVVNKKGTDRACQERSAIMMLMLCSDWDREAKRLWNEQKQWGRSENSRCRHFVAFCHCELPDKNSGRERENPGTLSNRNETERSKTAGGSCSCSAAVWIRKILWGITFARHDNGCQHTNCHRKVASIIIENITP